MRAELKSNLLPRKEDGLKREKGTHHRPPKVPISKGKGKKKGKED